MTTNQVALANLREQARHNRAAEENERIKSAARRTAANASASLVNTQKQLSRTQAGLNRMNTAVSHIKGYREAVGLGRDVRSMFSTNSEDVKAASGILSILL